MADSTLNSAIYERTSILVGEEGIRRLQNAKILVVGVGGVGGHCAEALIRAGVGTLYICDHDVVSLTNKNRQLTALDSTVGRSKACVLANRFADINRACKVHIIDAFLLPEDLPEILERESFDCVVDCIDSVESKISLVAACARRNIPIFVSGGAGGRMDPCRIKVCDIFDTENDALLRRLRGDLRRFGVTTGQVECVYSTEPAKPPLPPAKQEAGGRDRAVNGTMSYLPPAFGLFLSSRVLQLILDPVGYKKEIEKREKERLKILNKNAGKSSATNSNTSSAAAASASSAAKEKKQERKNKKQEESERYQQEQQQRQAERRDREDE